MNYKMPFIITNGILVGMLIQTYCSDWISRNNFKSKQDVDRIANSRYFTSDEILLSQNGGVFIPRHNMNDNKNISLLVLLIGSMGALFIYWKFDKRPNQSVK
jgi:hypothetical protein